MNIYRIVNKLNGKQYIGQTIHDLQKRFKQHQYKTTSALYLAIKKYGFENFYIELIDTANNINELNDKEEYYIEFYNTYAPLGYNIASGGKNFTRSELVKKRISEGLIGRVLTIETKQKLRKANLGKKISEQTKRKISEGLKGKTLGRKHSDKTKEKMSKAKIGKPQKSLISIQNCINYAKKTQKQILCLNNNIIYESITKAAKDLKLQRENIRKVLYNKRTHTGGYSFKFINKEI